MSSTAYLEAFIQHEESSDPSMRLAIPSSLGMMAMFSMAAGAHINCSCEPQACPSYEGAVPVRIEDAHCETRSPRRNTRQSC